MAAVVATVSAVSAGELTAIAVCAAIVAVVAYRLGALTGAGSILLALIGFVIGARLGVPMLAVSTAGFAAVVVSSKVHDDQPRDRPGARRDAIDLLPVVAVLTIGAAIGGARGHFVVFCALSFALADILASELGPLSHGLAIAIPTFRTVPHGVDGAVSLSGSAWGATASLAVGAAALPDIGLRAAAAVFVAGQFGAYFDSALMSTWHSTTRFRNDIVNAVAVCAAVIAGWLLWVS